MIKFVILLVSVCVGSNLYATDMPDPQQRLLCLRLEQNRLEQELLLKQIQHGSSRFDSVFPDHSPRGGDKFVSMRWKNTGLSDNSIGSCIKQIENKIMMEQQDNLHQCWWLNIDMSENYLTNDALKEFALFSSQESDEGEQLRKRLVKLDMSNNRVTGDGLAYAKTILEKCPYVTILLSINHIGSEDINRAFTSSDSLLKRLKWQNNA